MSFRVIVQPRAKRDINDLYDWIAERSPEGAGRWADRCEEAIRMLAANPHRFGLAPESDFVSQEIRQVTFRTRRGRPYRALFWIDGSVVRVLHVRGPGQPPVLSSELE